MPGPFNPYADTAVYLGALRLPTATAFDISTEWNQTDLPIERGALITDHRRRQPKTVRVSGIATGQSPIIGVPIDPLVVRKAIELLAETGTIFTIKWGFRIWRNMVILSIEEPANPAEMREDQWMFSLSCKETRVATSTTIPAAPVDPSIADTTVGAAEGGAQAGTAVGPEAASQVTGVVGGGV